MKLSSHKTWLERLIKIAILLAAIWVIASKFQQINWRELWQLPWRHLQIILPLFFLLWLQNLLLDASIWQRVHNMLAPLTFQNALKTNFICYALAFITPANSGELAGRYLSFAEPEHRSKTFFLTFWSHWPRLIVKLVLGLLCLSFWIPSLLWLAVPVITATLIGYWQFVKIQNWLAQRGWRQFQLSKYIIQERPSSADKGKLLLLAVAKFFTYNSQFLLLILLWTNTSLSTELLVSIIAMYVAGALLPTLPAADFLVKAGIALVIFDPRLIPQSVIIAASLATWLFNLALPALLGSLLLWRTNIGEIFKKKAQRDNPYDPAH